MKNKKLFVYLLQQFYRRRKTIFIKPMDKEFAEDLIGPIISEEDILNEIKNLIILGFISESRLLSGDRLVKITKTGKKHYKFIYKNIHHGRKTLI